MFERVDKPFVGLATSPVPSAREMPWKMFEPNRKTLNRIEKLTLEHWKRALVGKHGRHDGTILFNDLHGAGVKRRITIRRMWSWFEFMCHHSYGIKSIFIGELGFELTDEGREAVAEADALRLTNKGKLNV